MDTKNCMLSFCIVTYNHAKYIQECLEHLFQQRMDCAMEVLIGDDCSSDGTADIIQKNYGNKVTLIRHEKNVGLCKNMYDLVLRAKGKYVCTFSGDDYLYDDEVLQKQIDFLEENPEYFSVSGRILTYNQDKGTYTERKTKVGDYTIFDFLSNGNIPCADGIVRNIFKSDEMNNSFLQNGAKNNEEMKWWIYLLDKGKKYIFEDYMTVYRYRSKEGESNYCSNNNYLTIFSDYYEDLKMMESYYGKKYRLKPLELLIANDYCMAISNDKNKLWDFMKIMKVRDRLTFFVYKLYLKYHNYQSPRKWKQKEYLLR